jgi:hypothetical protein
MKEGSAEGKERACEMEAWAGEFLIAIGEDVPPRTGAVVVVVGTVDVEVVVFEWWEVDDDSDG